MEEVIVLRAEGASREGRPGAGEVRGAARAAPSIERERVDAHQLAELIKDPDVAVVANLLETRLIEPVAAASGASAPGWGVDAVQAADSPFDGANVKVAVLDTGIDATHAAFNGITLEQRDFTGCGDGDRHGHGTHCAGTIFGRDIAGQRIGVARGVTHAFIGKTLDDRGRGSSEMLFKALQWAAGEGVHVISMSVGFDYPGTVARRIADGWPAELAASAALEAYRENLRLFDRLMALLKSQAGAFGTEAVIFAASGNESRRAVRPDWRIGASLPAAAEQVIAVAAVERDGVGFKIADFSNSRARICGPGVDIVSAAPGGGVATMSGTSMACPHAAGVAALWWQCARAGRGRADAQAVRAQVLANARTSPFTSFDAFDLGDGIVTAPGVAADPR